MPLPLDLARPRVLLAPFVAVSLACHGPRLNGEPFAYLEQGRAGLSFKQPLVNSHDLFGEFDGGPIPDPGGGPDNYFYIEDDGSVLGKYELALAVRQVLSETTTIEFGLGYRQYDIEGIDPAPDPDIKFNIETIDSLQFYGALRRYFEAPNWLGARWRTFLELGLFFVPGVRVDSSLNFLTTSQPIEASGAPYEFAALTAGLAYALTDTTLLEFGATWEEPLRPLEIDLTTSVNFGPTVITIPMEASMRPVGGLLFLSLTWFPLAEPRQALPLNVARD